MGQGANQANKVCRRLAEGQRRGDLQDTDLADVLRRRPCTLHTEQGLDIPVRDLSEMAWERTDTEDCERQARHEDCYVGLQGAVRPQVIGVASERKRIGGWNTGETAGPAEATVQAGMGIQDRGDKTRQYNHRLIIYHRQL